MGSEIKPLDYSPDNRLYPTWDINNLRRYWFAASLVQGYRVLDIGPGPDRALEVLFKMSRQISGQHFLYTSLDQPEIDLDAGLPPTCTQYDTVYCLEVLEHLKDPESLAVALPALAGRVVISVPIGDAVNAPGHRWEITYEDLYGWLDGRNRIIKTFQPNNVNQVVWLDR